MRAVLIGYGEVGQGVYDVFNKDHDVTIHDPEKNYFATSTYDIMLVAMPFFKTFVEVVLQYKKRFRVKDIVVFSTVPIGTCASIGAVHSPVVGKHPKLATSIRLHRRWVGGPYSDLIYKFFMDSGKEPIWLPEAAHTEFLKMRSTSLYGINIEFARYTKEAMDGLDIDYKFAMYWDQDYNDLYRALGMKEYQRYILTPPEGQIGGHCVVPNAELLDLQYPHPFLKEIYANTSNKRQKRSNHGSPIRNLWEKILRAWRS